MTIAPPPEPGRDSPPMVPADAVGADHLSVAAGLAAAAAELKDAVDYAELADLEEAPVDHHVARYDAVHARLQDALTSVDTV